MSTSTQTCIECDSTSFEFSSEAGRDVCTICGTLTLINTGFETLGRTLEGEDDEFGRVFLRDGGTSYAGGNARNRDGRTIAKDGTSVDEYHHNKRVSWIFLSVLPLLGGRDRYEIRFVGSSLLNFFNVAYQL